MNKKNIAVVGATGAQGGGLVRAILKDENSEFTVRAITRNVKSEKARVLSKLGAEVVEANLDDLSSITKAFEGAYGAFCVTFFWDHLSPEKEMKQAKAMATAAQKAGVKHVIWSTLEDTRKWVPLDDQRMPTLQGKYKVPHLDAKGEANHYFTDLELPVTFLHTSYYWDNLTAPGMGLQKDENGQIYLTFPMGDKKLPGIAAEDIGRCAYGIFKKGSKFIGKSVFISGENLTGVQMAATLSKALGKKVVYRAMEPKDFRKLGFPGADDISNMFQFKRDFEEVYSGARDVNATQKLNPQLQTFDRWLAANRKRISIN